MSEFSDRPLYAGTVVGLRAFRVDRIGRLIGPQQLTVFTPGENTGVCRTDPMTAIMQRARQRLTQSVRAGVVGGTAGGGPNGGPLPVELPHSSDHGVGSINCTCGFYAYFDGSNDYHLAGATIQAIVEGYGTVTVGDRGFRSEKARLLALVLPPEPKGWEIVEGRRVSRWTLFWTLWCLVFLIVDVARQDWLLVAFLGVCVAINLFSAWIQLQRRPLSERAALVRRNYPDVPTYPTLRKALKAHPLSPAPEVTPETCDDFWIRRAGA